MFMCGFLLMQVLILLYLLHDVYKKKRALDECMKAQLEAQLEASKRSMEWKQKQHELYERIKGD